MKKHPVKRKGLSRKVRTLIHLFVILLCVTLVLLVKSIPSSTPEEQFRRLEQGYMIGPSNILGTETISKSGDLKLLIAKSDTDLMLYRYAESEYRQFTEKSNRSTDLVCRKKNGDLTILAAGGRSPYFSNNTEPYLPIVLFDEYPEAIRAEIEFTLSIDTYKDTEGIVRDESLFRLNSTRTNDGYFYFTISPSVKANEGYLQMLVKLASMTSNWGNVGYTPTPIPVTVHLYDKNNQLIVDQTIYFQHPDEDLLQK